MKKIIYIFAVIAITLTSCDKNEVAIQKEVTTTITPEQQKMRNALERTTNILLNMISNDQKYFEEIDAVIKAGSPEYLEDRVMLKDLFTTTSNSSALRVKANVNRFTADFKTAFSTNKPQKVGGINSGFFSNPDSLILYLTKNNVILNCPYPLADYAEDNRTPAITFDPMNNDTVNIGFLLDVQGNYIKVNVSQAYADKHPVWILIPNQKEKLIVNIPKSNDPLKSKLADNDGLRTTINKIYLTEYYCSIFWPALNMRILRSGNGFSWNDQTKNYNGTFAQMNTFEMPRKYVGYAKNRQLNGWYPVNIEWDYSWYSDKKEQAISVYEHDSGSSITLSSTIKAIIPGVGEAGVTISGTFTNTDDVIVLQPLGRDYLLNIINNGHRNSVGNIDWFWEERVSKRDPWHRVDKIDGNYIYRFSPSFMMTFSVQ